MARGRAPDVRSANSATAASSTSVKTFLTTEFPMAATVDQRDKDQRQEQAMPRPADESLRPPSARQ